MNAHFVFFMVTSLDETRVICMLGLLSCSANQQGSLAVVVKASDALCCEFDVASLNGPLWVNAAHCCLADKGTKTTTSSCKQNQNRTYQKSIPKPKKVCCHNNAWGQPNGDGKLWVNSGNCCTAIAQTATGCTSATGVYGG